MLLSVEEGEVTKEALFCSDLDTLLAVALLVAGAQQNCKAKMVCKDLKGRFSRKHQ